MALGIGANTSIFSLVDTALLRPLAVHEPSQLVELYGTIHNGADWTLQSYPNYKDYRDRNYRKECSVPTKALDYISPCS